MTLYANLEAGDPARQMIQAKASNPSKGGHSPTASQIWLPEPGQDSGSPCPPWLSITAAIFSTGNKRIQ